MPIAMTAMATNQTSLAVSNLSADFGAVLRVFCSFFIALL
jgi:hypothetical protein